MRMITFMIYLTDVEAGGRTVFPQAGISVKPVMGSALYWFNAGARYNYDSRSFHLGCPVLYGNKWIANKWIKQLASFESYPCLVDHKEFSIRDKRLLWFIIHLLEIKSIEYYSSSNVLIQVLWIFSPNFELNTSRQG